MNYKPSNPKDGVGIKKVGMSAVPAPVMAEVALGMMEGARKYGRHNYRAIGVRASVYYDATMRHLMAWWEGQDTDPDSGLSHITKAITSLVVLRDAMMQGNLTDDRPIAANDPNWQQPMNKHVEVLIDKYPTSAPDYTKEYKPETEKAAPVKKQLSQFIDHSPEQPAYVSGPMHSYRSPSLGNPDQLQSKTVCTAPKSDCPVQWPEQMVLTYNADTPQEGSDQCPESAPLPLGFERSLSPRESK